MLRDQDGTTFIFYTGAGEQNIGIVKLEVVDIWQDVQDRFPQYNICHKNYIAYSHPR